jgi:hypothetical protein
VWMCNHLHGMARGRNVSQDVERGVMSVAERDIVGS